MAKTLRFVRPTSFDGMFHEVGEPIPDSYTDADIDNLRASGQIDDVEDKSAPAPAAPAEQPKKKK